MDKWLSRWTARIMVLVILMSFVTWSTAEETTSSGSEGSQASVLALDVDLSQYKTLTVGYTGPEVAALKQRMFELGYFKTNTINESYTATTADYIKKFEKMNGLPVDGVADPEMLALFFSDKARKADGSLLPVRRLVQLPEIMIESSKEYEINQRFHDFLGEVGDFGEEMIEVKRHYLKSSGMPLRDLGFHEGSEDRADVQGILLSHFRFGDSELLAFGIKDRQGLRRITLVEWPALQKMKIPNFKCFFSLSSGNSSSSMFLNTEEDVTAFLEWKTGSLGLCTYLFTVDINKIPEDETLRRAYYVMLISRKNINLDYVSSLLFPKKSTLRKWETKYYDRKAKTKQPEISSVQDIREYLIEAPILPVTTSLTVSGSTYALPEWLENNKP